MFQSIVTLRASDCFFPPGTLGTSKQLRRTSTCTFFIFFNPFPSVSVFLRCPTSWPRWPLRRGPDPRSPASQSTAARPPAEDRSALSRLAEEARTTVRTWRSGEGCCFAPELKWPGPGAIYGEAQCGRVSTGSEGHI